MRWLAIVCACLVPLVSRRTTSKALPCPAPTYPLPESLPSPSGAWTATLRPHSHDLLKVEIRSRRGGSHVVRAELGDVVSVMWSRDDRSLFYAISPIYGVPGIYVLSLPAGKQRRIVAPSNKTQYYRDGADYFILCSADRLGDGRQVVHYLHFPDVDAMDFRNLPLDAPQEADTV